MLKKSFYSKWGCQFKLREVKALEQQCMDEGFTRGFLKGVRLVQYKVFEDPSSGLDGAEIESELNKAFSSNDESVNVE
ncbi:hypothetical protein IEQ34_003805 [Dendrobium chrysotoxum]|uniref:Uncharacterized protein n=1 Tax=Dendrobium chrysotoxum TaxID=161865 RepID=A0AAV7HE32_DENCH|nr:hypothetical protein IEQ34_003805 [Dendrobium chrysotoxum]